MNRTGDFRDSERGQAMVLIVLTIVAVFGFGALAIDMGQILYARRSAQAAADTAALAAAFDSAAGSKNRVTAMNKAVAMANTNGFNNDGVTNTVVVNNGPVGGPYCEICGLPNAKEYFQVRITVIMKPIFAQFIYSGAEQTTVEAIARAKSSGPSSGADALLALSSGDDAFVFDGTVGVTVNGGNIRSNGGMTKNGGGSGNITVPSPGHIYYNRPGPFNPLGPFKAAKPETSSAVNIVNIDQPYCPAPTDDFTGWTSGDGYKTKNIKSVDYYYYPSGIDKHDDRHLPAGIHCIYGDIDGRIYGTNVLVVQMTGGIKETGNGSGIDIQAASSLIDKNGNQFGGLVYYSPKSNITENQELKFGGNANSYIQGTFYAPGATCDLGGNSNGKAYHTAFICNKFKFHGTPDLLITYKAEELLRLSPTVELVQ